MRALLLAVLMLAAPIGAGFAPGDAPTADGPAVETAGSDTAVGEEAAVHSDGIASNTTNGDGNETGNESVDRRYRVLAAPDGVGGQFGIDRHGTNIGPAAGLEIGDTTAAMETEAVVDRIEAAETVDERQRRIVAAESDLRQAEVSLHSRQRSAISAHAAGRLTDQELLAELVSVARTAERLDERRAALDELADDTEDFSLNTGDLQVRLDVYTGPVRSHAAETLRSDSAADRIAVETNGETVVLTAIIGDQYVREVYRGDRWDRGASSFEDPTDALEETVAAYPQAGETRLSDGTLGTGPAIRVTIPHEQGQLRTFVSSGDGGVFVEHQHRELETFDDADPISTTQDGLNLTVKRTYPGGPVKVSVTDADTGDPARGLTVTIGDDATEVGTTDANGVLWTLSPNEPYQVTVIDEPRVARISGIEPTDVPRIDEADGDDPDDGDYEENGGDEDGSADDDDAESDGDGDGDGT